MEPVTMGAPRVRRILVALLFAGLAAGAVAASRLGYVERLRARLERRIPRLSAGDFPAGVAAPVDDVAAIPTRPTRLGVVPRGCVAPLLWAGGDAERLGLFRSAYALEVLVQAFESEDALRRALLKGGENGGVDLAALSVSTLAMQAAALRDAAPRAVLLLGRSRGQEVVGAKASLPGPAALAGKRLGTESRSASNYFALWVLSRAGLSTREVTMVPLASAFEAGRALRENQVDAVAGYLGDVGPATKDLGGGVLSSTADAPHLVATVLVARGDFAAKYPDAIRRVIRGTLDANAQTLKDEVPAARVLGAVEPRLGDPQEAINAAPPATLKENLAFFGLAGEAPVTWTELYQSAQGLAQKLSGTGPGPGPEETADLGALKYVSSGRGRSE